MSTSTTDSAETRRLLEQLEQGDRAAFELLFARHRASILKLASRRLDARIRARLDPSDIVQETHLEAARLLDDFLARRPMPFSLWLMKTAHQRVAKAHRWHLEAAKRSVKREIPLPDGSSLRLVRRIVGAGTSPTSAFERQERAQRVRQALARLNDSEREVILLRIFEGLASREVACVLDITAEAAQKRYARGLLKLRALLQDKP
jgi:RNA polymerase sigma-70 factor (ECF subfamily)